MSGARSAMVNFFVGSAEGEAQLSREFHSGVDERGAGALRVFSGELGRVKRMPSEFFAVVRLGEEMVSSRFGGDDGLGLSRAGDGAVEARLKKELPEEEDL